MAMITLSPSGTTKQQGRALQLICEKLGALRVHFVGVGGCGMSALAALLVRRGARVSGSDQCASEETRRLAQRGVQIATGNSAVPLPDGLDALVVSAAIPPQHPEIREAERRGIPVYKYAQMLGALLDCHEGIAIAGTHGKSTTTAWLAYVLRRAGLDPSFIVGATVDQLGGGSGDGAGPHFVAEACEYDRSFLNLRPRRAAVLNIEEDHLDCYADLEAIRGAFAAFVGGIPADGLLVLNAADARCATLREATTARVQTFGCVEGATWRADRLELVDGRYAFDVLHVPAAERASGAASLSHEGPRRPHEVQGQCAGAGKQQTVRLGRVHLPLAGAHNVQNALAVIALAQDCGVDWQNLLPGLTEFNGARRRLELRGRVNGITILDDYAHHPTEIRATLRAARERYQPRRLWCIFQPHQHSRTRFLLADFAQSFSEADRVVVPDIYFVRDSQRERELVCAADLVRAIRDRGGDATYLADFDAIVERLRCECERADVVITMGAGSIWSVADALVQRLGGDLPA